MARSKKAVSCPAETTLKIIGGRWKLMILRQLAAGASRFGAGTRLGKRINIFLEAHRLMVAIVVGLLIYGAILTSHASAAVGGSDSAGYANMARSILDGEITPPIAALSQLDLPESFGPLFFAAAHLGQLIAFPVLFLLGGLLAYARVYSGGLALPMVLHFLHNFAVLFLGPYIEQVHFR